jgi:hypothetical protein
MRFTILLMVVACAHNQREVKFSDNSEDNKIGWVCVPKDKYRWACVSIETFREYLRDAESKHVSEM